MDSSDNLLEQLERHLQFLKDSGVQYLPLKADLPSPHSVVTDNTETTLNTVPGNILTSASGETLFDIEREFANCVRCDHGGLKKNIIFGSGKADADLMFIGTSPGRYEETEKEPFPGEAGELLTKIIGAIKLSPEEVYLTNLIKCTAPDERDATGEEALSCITILKKQIMAVKPLVICTLGEFTARMLLDTSEPLSSLRGRFYNFEGLPLMPTYHPSYILKNPEVKRDVWEDMKQIMKMLEERR